MPELPLEESGESSVRVTLNAHEVKVSFLLLAYGISADPTMSDASPRIELRPTSTPASAEKHAECMKNLGFGRVYTDNMVEAAYRAGEGWGSAVLKPYGPIQLDPAASVLHYGQAIFEGFKAYAQKDGSVATFRPEMNAARFNASARRLAMPELPEDFFIAAADALIRQERRWVPSAIGESLYLRPLMIASEAALGVRPATEYRFLLIASPSGAYFLQGMKPVSVWISRDFVRAAPGGTGAVKCAGNYAASLVAQSQAISQGCDQVVWLDAVRRRYVEEMGGMNLFFVYHDSDGTYLVTPELTGTLLPGVTRDSIIALAGDLGYRTEERRLSVDRWATDLESGKMTEVFACGTAAVITPVGTVKSKAGQWTIHGGTTGPIAAQLREALLSLQHGVGPDPHGWVHPVP